MYDLYSKFIHFNEFDNKWYVFERDEQMLYLNDKTKMKSLKSFDSMEKLLETYKKESND